MSRQAPPADWCLPSFYPTVKSWEDAFGHGRAGGPLIVGSNCHVDDDCRERPSSCIARSINCSPEGMRADAERKMQSLGASVWPANKRLSLDAYALARNLMSEFGRGTPTEKVAVALVAMNRAASLDGRDIKTPGAIANHLLGATKRFGNQTGSSRPASTAQDPSVADILVADYLLREARQGHLRDITWGATHYLDRQTQDAMAKNGAATGAEVYAAWAAGGDALTWVGHVPGVRPWRLMLMRRRPELRGDASTRHQVFVAGLDALNGKNRPVDTDAICFDPTILSNIFYVSAMGVGGFIAAQAAAKMIESITAKDVVASATKAFLPRRARR